MKTIITLLLVFSGLLLFSQCSNPSPESALHGAEIRAQYISALINNDTYMREVMDTMRTKHPDVYMTTVIMVMKNDKAMQAKMMNTLMSMYGSDSSMCNMMMDKTMDICDADQSKCKMMVGSMHSHPKAMKSMQDMGMCNMKEMKMEQKK